MPNNVSEKMRSRRDRHDVSSISASPTATSERKGRTTLPRRQLRPMPPTFLLPPTPLRQTPPHPPTHYSSATSCPISQDCLASHRVEIRRIRLFADADSCSRDVSTLAERFEWRFASLISRRWWICSWPLGACRCRWLALRGGRVCRERERERKQARRTKIHARFPSHGHQSHCALWIAIRLGCEHGRYGLSLRLESSWHVVPIPAPQSSSSTVMSDVEELTACTPNYPTCH